MCMPVGSVEISVEVSMTKMFSSFVRDESGATAIEYGLIAALIAVVIIGALQAIGTNLNTVMTNVAGSLK
jgi:pilus assembly protein Flp/PilA